MYRAHVVSIRNRQCALRLVPEHPESMPYYVSSGFGAATLWSAGGQLAREFPRDDFVKAMATGELDGSRFVELVTINNVHGFPWTFEATQTAADYVITVTDERWLEGIELGHSFDNGAHCERGAYLSPVEPDEVGQPMPWWFAGHRGTHPKDVIRDLDVLQMLKNAGIE